MAFACAVLIGEWVDLKLGAGIWLLVSGIWYLVAGVWLRVTGCWCLGCRSELNPWGFFYETQNLTVF